MVDSDLKDREIKLLKKLGKGDVNNGIRHLINYMLGTYKQHKDPEHDANKHIIDYLELTGNLKDTMKAKDVYDEYLGSSSNPVGKHKFNELLRTHGFIVKPHSHNINTIFNIKSNYL